MATIHLPPPLPSFFSDPGLLESGHMYVVIYPDEYTILPWLKVTHFTAL